MARKRGNHEGSIHRRCNGTWRAQVTLDGRRLGFTADTRQECQEWLKKVNRQIDDGLTYAHTKVTIGEFLISWLSSSKASKRRATWVQYNQVSRSYIIPFIGHICIKDLRPDLIQGLYDQHQAQDVGAYSILKIHTVLHSALSHAVKLGIIGRNPASVVMLPREPDIEMSILDESQVSQMLMTARGHRWEALFWLTVVTGARQRELLALKWTDLDWTKLTIKIERQLDKSNGEGVKFAPPKSRSGRRTLALGARTIEVMRDHYERQHAERKAVGDQWVEHGLIFTNSLGGPIDPRNLLRSFKRLLKNAGLPEIRFHDLRHTGASLMLNHGIPVIVVSRRLGHARPSITLDVYGHLIPSMQVEAAEKIDDLITPIELHPVAPDLHPSQADIQLNPHV